jgi:hypothetical protein
MKNQLTFDVFIFTEHCMVQTMEDDRDEEDSMCGFNDSDEENDNGMDLDALEYMQKWTKSMIVQTQAYTKKVATDFSAEL